MGGDEPSLTVRASAHLLRTAQQNTNFTVTDLRKQFVLLRLGVGLMDKGDFLRGNALGDQLIPNVLIHAGFQPDGFLVNLILRVLFCIVLLPFLGFPLRFALGRRQIGENKLCT